ncbi:MAG: hypothetical protein JWR52_3384 [Marmoricola sp.]|nr:hypothetical protein [Marmoricola sp.]
MSTPSFCSSSVRARRSVARMSPTAAHIPEDSSTPEPHPPARRSEPGFGPQPGCTTNHGPLPRGHCAHVRPGSPSLRSRHGRVRHAQLEPGLPEPTLKHRAALPCREPGARRATIRAWLARSPDSRGPPQRHLRRTRRPQSGPRYARSRAGEASQTRSAPSRPPPSLRRVGPMLRWPRSAVPESPGAPRTGQLSNLVDELSWPMPDRGRRPTPHLRSPSPAPTGGCRGCPEIRSGLTRKYS